MNMKKLITIVLSTALLMFSLSSASAQNNNKDWKDRMKAEKIAFLTDAMDLTSAEAQAFWPVYNEAEAEKDKSFRAVMDAYKALEDADKANKSDSEIEPLLNNYINAIEKGKDLDAKYVEQYRKILSEKKVAKLYLGEEAFRRQQIHRLHNFEKK